HALEVAALAPARRGGGGPGGLARQLRQHGNDRIRHVGHCRQPSRRTQKNGTMASVSVPSTEPPPSPARARPPLWATLVATSCGAGFVPVAPGHSGTLTAVALAWGLSHVGA